MEFRFTAEDWNALSLDERARRCRLLAEQAIKLANTAPELLKESYITIALGWLKLAAEIEHIARRADPHE